jgi:hypothetical protein
MGATTNSKDRLFTVSERIPLLGGAADPFMATVLGVFICVTLVAVEMPDRVFPGDRDARTHVLQLASGLLVVGGFYFVAVTLRSTRAMQHADRLVTTIALLGSADDATRIAAIRLLEAMAHPNPNVPKDNASRAMAAAQRDAIVDALRFAANEQARPLTASAAREAITAVQRDTSSR